MSECGRMGRGAPKVTVTRNGDGEWGESANRPAPFFVCVHPSNHYVVSLVLNTLEKVLNAELTKKALEKVGNPNVLVNMVSRRVRQLNSGGGAAARPLVADVGNLGAADIALLDIIEA